MAPSPEIETATPPPETESPEEAAVRIHEEALLEAETVLASHFEADFSTRDFILWLEQGVENLLSHSDMFSDKAAFNALLYENTGKSLNVLLDEFSGKLGDEATARSYSIYFAPESGREEIVLAFGGDVNLTDSGYVMPTYRAYGDISKVLTGGLLEELRSADVLLLNNEFAFTASSTPMPGKTYTFAANPENVSLLTDMGVDIAYLANNHVYDYGETGLADTLATLDAAGIARIGAGTNIDEAKSPVYYIAGGRKIAFVGAGCIERYSIFTPGATVDGAGIFRTDEKTPEVFLELIREVSEHSDYVIANLHWGIESTTILEDYQRELAQMCIDAGADAVLGAHPHVLQGPEFYQGRPIVYSMGNFWFSRTQNKTCLIELVIDAAGDMSIRFLPCVTGGGITSLASGQSAAEIISYYESISFGVSIDENGFMSVAG